MNRHSFHLLIVAVLLAADQITKFLVANIIEVHSRVTIIPGVFSLVHVRNRGAIFGFFSGAEKPAVFILLTGASFAALGLVIFYFIRTPKSEKAMKSALSLILAGALGNLIDRLLRGYVIDFLDFSFKGWHWPSFNVADSCITVGALVLVGVFLFKRG
ncbi:MAG: signal peptidase II [Candidatus Aminicenantales bacterium]